MAGDTSDRSIAILGAGYVGTELAKHALGRGWRVAALTRNHERAAGLRALGCAHVVEHDIADDAWHGEIGGPFDFVVNCTSPGGGGIEGYRHSCLSGNESLARWVATMPAGTAVCTSSTGVYPQGGGARVDESAPVEKGGGRGGLLSAAEEAFKQGATAAGWRWFVLRLAGIYGPGRHHLLDQVRGGGPLHGDPSVHLNLIHLDDICSAIHVCLMTGGTVGPGTFNLSDGAPGTRLEAAGWLASRLGVPVPGFTGAATSNPFGRRATPDRVIDPSRFREAFGWTPRHLDFRSGFSKILERSE